MKIPAAALLLPCSQDQQCLCPPQEQALKLRREVLGETHPHTLSSLTNLVGCTMSAGHYDDACPLCEHLLDLNTQLLGKRHPASVACMRGLADCLEALGGSSMLNWLKASQLRTQAQQLEEQWQQQQ